MIVAAALAGIAGLLVGSKVVEVRRRHRNERGPLSAADLTDAARAAGAGGTSAGATSGDTAAWSMAALGEPGGGGR